MTIDTRGAGALDYFPCLYGTSKIRFRGPKRKLEGDYVAFLGGTDTYGKFIPRPFPALVEDRLGVPCVNFGWMNAGVDAFLNDQTVMDATSRARASVIQVMGAQNMSNRYYAVHPRRNDRFLKASPLMRKVYRNADFTEFHFTRHMLRDLRDRSIERFDMLIAELQEAWLARMEMLIERVETPSILLWFADHRPGDVVPGDGLSHDPLFVTAEMIDALRPKLAGVVEVTASPIAQAAGSAGMVFDQLEAPMVAGILGPTAHGEASEAVAAELSGLLGITKR